MIHRIYVRCTQKDTRVEVRNGNISRDFPDLTVEAVSLVENYTICKQLKPKQLESAAHMLAHPAIEESSCDSPLIPEDFSWSFEIGLLPGVTDNTANTAKESICDLLRVEFTDGEGVYSSQTTFLKGALTYEQVFAIAQCFSNPLIHHIEIQSRRQWLKGEVKPYAPEVTLPPPSEVLEVDLEVSEEELIRLGREGVPDPTGGRRGPLALDRESLLAIREYFRSKGRNPTDIELESLAQTWSEHCKHTIFAASLDELNEGLYKTYIQGATKKIRKAKGRDDFCVSVFRDNSGAIAFDDEYLITDKVETHNSPCALDPFGGAITGIVGVNRDTIGCGLGAKPVANRYGYCLARPEDAAVYFRDKELKDPLLSPRRILEGVVYGVNVGGNCSGIPTPQGFVYFDHRYRGKPLVFVGTVGLMPRISAGRPSHQKKARPGDVIVMVGGRVGRDGIHGATFSSEGLSAGSPATAVQIGDPITQKKLSDAIVKEARDRALYNSITDNGAGGLSCSVAEMAREAGGCFVEIEKVPLKYPGLEPWQIWVSESQERMTVAVRPERLQEFLELMRSRAVEATPIGHFDDSGRCRVSCRGKLIMDVELQFLHEGLPCKKLKSKRPAAPPSDRPDKWPENFNDALIGVLGDPNAASYSFISRQYDHEVQGGSVIKPLAGKGEVNAHATVIRPLLDRLRGIVLSQALFPSYGDLDPYGMAACGVDAAVRQAVVAGGSIGHLALLDNTCWCSSYDPVRLWQLKEAIRACHDYAVAFGTPFISGKDSMFNDFSGYNAKGEPVQISVPPTILISSMGVVKDVRKCVSLDLKSPGDLIYVLGKTGPEMGGSNFLAWWGEKVRGKRYLGRKVPEPAAGFKSLYAGYEKAVSQGLVTSAEAVSIGGLAVSLARQAVGGALGVEADLGLLPEGGGLETAACLFSETPGRITCTVAPENKETFERLFEREHVVCIGKVNGEGVFRLSRGERELINLSLPALYEAYHSTFRGF